jgi:AcrR family transcriptional regulator
MAAVGHREALLEGAKQCLGEQGYGRTTARDIVEASGTNLASIGYHFGSKEGLLTEAMISAIEEWGEEMARIVPDEPAEDADRLDRLAVVWSRVLETFSTHRAVWGASFEAFVHAQHAPELRARLADAMEAGRTGLAKLFQGVAEDAPEARAVGSVHLALLDGLMIQWMLDPERAPSGEDFADGLRTILAMGR